MKETFDADLSETQKEEAANLKAFEELKAAKESEIAAGTAQIDMKTQELAKTDESNANAKQDLEDTKNSLSADEQFLMNLKEHCSMTDKEWEERTKTRQLEMEACSKALAILNSDDSHDLFTKTFTFVQKRVTTNSKIREQASKVVADVASKNRSPQLVALAVRIRLDAFTRVKKAIDDMVAMLLKEQEDEKKQKDFCVDEFHTNEVQTTNKDRDKEDLLQKIEELTQTIKELTEAIATLKAEIAELHKQVKYAGEDREKANQEFQTTIADQRETQKVLAAALKFLTDYYGKTAAMDAEKTVLMQQTPPAAFKKFEDSKSSGGVMDMIQNIINDAKTMEAETIRAEEDAQKAYEDFVKESNASIEAKTEELVNKSELKAATEAEKVATIKAKDNVLLELEQLANYNAQLHSSCDFVLKNFDLRQKARAEEVEALRTAKQILSGANFQEFLQR
jgi:outer membrane murein-binding lipoprotein Lpp